MSQKNADKKYQDKLVYEIVEKLGIIAENSSGWTKELNKIAWNNKEPKLDIRDWDAKHEHMSKGVTLREDEARVVLELLNGYFAG